MSVSSGLSGSGGRSTDSSGRVIRCTAAATFAGTFPPNVGSTGPFEAAHVTSADASKMASERTADQAPGLPNIPFDFVASRVPAAAQPGRGRTLPTDAGMAWWHGLRLHCIIGLMAILLAIGVMDLCAMAVVAAAITVERINGERVARATGAVLLPARRGLQTPAAV